MRSASKSENRRCSSKRKKFLDFFSFFFSISFFSLVFRRNTLNVQKPLITNDGINIARRQSVTPVRRLSFQSQEVTESSKSKTNLRNFYVFFVSLFLFIFLAVVYSFIRMIKNQDS